MRLLARIGLAACLVGFMGCRSAPGEHPAIGDWLADGHSLRVYSDGTGSYDGLAVSWTKLRDGAIKLRLDGSSGTVLWEFEVTGSGSPAPVVADRVLPEPPAQRAAPQAIDQSGSQRLVVGDTFYTVTKVPDGVRQAASRLHLDGAPSALARKIEQARRDGREVGVLKAGLRETPFLRESDISRTTE